MDAEPEQQKEAEKRTATSLLVNVKELAGLLGGVTPRHIYAMNASGLLGPMAIRFGRRVLFNRQEIEDWVESGCPPRTKWLQIKKEIKR